ncbi:MAG TPA: TlpA disulfide reductase family protein [Polyangiaceae bacterium]|nr:TlpA disulfide reductase family protein [Polyangiaceae bacterium]
MAQRQDRPAASGAVAEDADGPEANEPPEAAEPPKPAPARRFARLRRFALEIGVVVVLFFALGAWQTRGLLPAGERMPAFDLVDLQGQRVRLSDFRGKTLLVHVWATWCGVCRREFSALNALHENLDRDEALVTIVADSRDRARLERFAREHQLEYPVLLASDELIENYKIEAFPTNYYVDGGGMLRDKTVGLSTRLSMTARMAWAK